MKTVTLLLLILLQNCGKRDLALFQPSTWFPEIIDNTEGAPLPLNTPANVLENIMLSYNTRNISLYEKLLSDDYRFYMSTSLAGLHNEANTVPDPLLWSSEVITVGNLPVIRYYISKAKDVASVSNMFSPVNNVSKISLSFQYSQVSINLDTAVFTAQNISLAISIKRSLTSFVIENGGGTLPTEITLCRNRENGNWAISRWYDNTYGDDKQN